MTPDDGFQSQLEDRLNSLIDERAIVLDGDDALAEFLDAIDAVVDNEPQTQGSSDPVTRYYPPSGRFVLCESCEFVQVTPDDAETPMDVFFLLLSGAFQHISPVGGHAAVGGEVGRFEWRGDVAVWFEEQGHLGERRAGGQMLQVDFNRSAS